MTLAGDQDVVNLPFGGSVSVLGADDSVHGGDSSTITVSGKGGDSVTAGTGSQVTVRGNVLGDYDSVAANESSIDLGASALARVSGDGDDIAVSTGSSLSLTGSNDTVTLADNAVATLGGNGNSVSARSGDSVDVTSGSNNAIVAAGGITVHITDAGGDRVNAGTASDIEVGGNGANGTSDWVGVDASTITVDPDANITAAGDGDNVFVGAGSRLQFAGYYSTINTAGSSEIDVQSGTADTVAAWNDCNAIDVGDAARDATINVHGSSDTLSLASSGNTANVDSNLSNELIIGSGETINLGNNDDVTIWGTDNIVNGLPSDDPTHGSGDTVNVGGTGASLDVVVV